MTPSGKSDKILGELQTAFKQRHARIPEWKSKSGNPVLGYFCSYTPVELIKAAGILPVRLLSTSEHIQESDAYMPHFACHFARSAVDLTLRGVTGYLDGVVAPRTCDTVRFAFEVWESHVPHSYSFLLQSPTLLKGDGVIPFWREEMARFKKSLEEFTGRAITSEDLQASIRVYNENRGLIRQVYTHSEGDSIRISGSERIEMLLAGLSMPVEEHNLLLRELVADLDQRAPRDKEKIRLMVISAALDESNLEIVREIEKEGGAVVVDSSCIGSRNILDDVAPGGDPLESIGDRYLNRIPCPSKAPVQPWFDNVVDLAGQYRADGAVFLIEKFCDPHSIAYPDLRDALKEKNVPSLKIDLGEAVAPLGQIKTRVGAFYEMIRGA